MKTEENFTPICPLLTAAMIAKTGNPIEVVTCRKSGCALWLEYLQQCSLSCLLREVLEVHGGFK